MKQLTALGGNIFAGLFTVGVKRAGYRVLGHLEHGPYGVATAQLNHPELVGRTWLHPSAWPAPAFFGRINLMFCNPPCAAWSSARASKKGSWEDHVERLAIIDHLTTYGIALKPDAWVWESVTNAWRHGRGFIDRIAGAWMDAGYSVTVLKQNNMYLGVPQNRPRILVTAHRRPLVLPPLTAPISFARALKSIRTKIPAAEKHWLSPGLTELWQRSPNLAYNVRRVFDAMDTKEQKSVLSERGAGRPSFMVSRIDDTKPMGVLLDYSKRLHPREPRYLAWQEMLAACGLPPDWRAACAYGPASAELSRAVMPPVGEWLATAVRDGLDQRPLRVPTYRVVHLDAGPEYVYEEVLIPCGDHRFGELQRWSDAPAPLPKRRAS